MERVKMLSLQMLLMVAAVTAQRLGQQAFPQQQQFAPLPTRAANSAFQQQSFTSTRTANSAFPQQQDQQTFTSLPTRTANSGFQQQQQDQQSFTSTRTANSAFPQQQTFPSLSTRTANTASSGRTQQPHQSTQTYDDGKESYQYINTLDTTAQRAQPTVQSTRTRASPVVRTFAEPQRVNPTPSFSPAPVEIPNAVPAPVQQHDAQVFTRGPVTAAPATATLKASTDFQRTQRNGAAQSLQQGLQRDFQQAEQAQTEQSAFVQQPETRAPVRTPQPAQDFQDFAQQDVVRPAQVTRTRTPHVRRPVESSTATRGTAAALRASPPRTPIVVGAQGANDDFLQPQEDELFREQAQNAHYTFTSAVDDKLTDNMQVRQETRDGLNLAGLYSYSDGFFRRTVHYEADENGYRVTKEEVEPIGDGPQPDPSGAAEVQANISGTDYRYRITADDIRKERELQAAPLERLQQ